ncbi:unnamed protein product [Musa textilis]
MYMLCCVCVLCVLYICIVYVLCVCCVCVYIVNVCCVCVCVVCMCCLCCVYVYVCVLPSEDTVAVIGRRMRWNHHRGHVNINNKGNIHTITHIYTYKQIHTTHT